MKKLDELLKKYPFLTEKSKKKLELLCHLIQHQSLDSNSKLNPDIRGVWGFLIKQGRVRLFFSPRIYYSTEEHLTLFPGELPFIPLKERGAPPVEEQEFEQRIKNYQAIVERL